MQQMQEIRNSFQEDIEESVKVAHALLAIASIGEMEITNKTCEEQNSSYQFVAPCTQSGLVNLEVFSSVTYKDIIGIYFNHKGALPELVHAQLIQKWYGFLNQLVEQMVYDHVSGVRLYPKIRNKKVELNLEVVERNNLVQIQEISRRFREAFDFEKGYEKLAQVANWLNIEVDKDLKDSIKKHIIVRNLLQHNHGCIRDSNLKELGKASIQLIDESINIKEFKVEERVKISIYELFRVWEDFHKVADTLILREVS